MRILSPESPEPPQKTPLYHAIHMQTVVSQLKFIASLCCAAL